MEIEIDADIEKMLPGAAIAISISGGKDSTACAIATTNYIKRAYPKIKDIILIHSDLGRIEWKDSMIQCKEVAAYLELELVVVKRNSGGMVERWKQRWLNNFDRYVDMKLVTMLLPWSTPAMRFCTSELKTQLIGRYLKKRYGGNVINVTGIRREESSGRKNAPTSKELNATVFGAGSRTWNPIAAWAVNDVWNTIDSHGMRHHEAYIKGNERVSCSFCIMASINDMVNATHQGEHMSVYRELVGLEQDSLFAFQGSRWLMDVNPDVLTKEQRMRIDPTKEKNRKLKQIEAEIKRDWMFVKGTPQRMLSIDEAKIMADVRNRVFDIYGARKRGHTDHKEILNRYKSLLIKANRPITTDSVVVPAAGFQQPLFA